VRLGREFLHAVDLEHSATQNLERIDQQRNRFQSRSHDLEVSAEAAEHLVRDTREQRQRLHGEFGTACEEIYLLGSPKIRRAADQLWDEAHKAMQSTDSGYTTARAAFLEAARQELGIMTSQHSLTYVEELPVNKP
jgi:hypothetical protein